MLRVDTYNNDGAVGVKGKRNSETLKLTLHCSTTTDTEKEKKRKRRFASLLSCRSSRAEQDFLAYQIIHEREWRRVSRGSGVNIESMYVLEESLLLVGEEEGKGSQGFLLAIHIP
jgi:hypothetical protein